MAKYNLTPEQRQAKSDAAKALVAAGKFGGRQPGAGRPSRKKLALAKIAEEAEKHSTQMVEALEAGLDARQPASVRVATVKEWTKMERDYHDIQAREEADMEAKATNVLLEELIGRIFKLKDLGALPAAVEEILDVEIVSEEDG